MTKKILIVDDEPGLLSAIQRLLELYDFHVLTASGGFEAFDIVKSHDGINFIISDMRMHNGNGIQFLELLKRDGFKIPFLLMTGFADISMKEAQEKGVIGIMSKPFDVEKLVEIIHENTKE